MSKNKREGDEDKPNGHPSDEGSVKPELSAISSDGHEVNTQKTETPTNPKPENDYKPPKKRTGRKMSRYEWTMIVITSIYVIVTGFYSSFALGQWCTMNRQLMEMRDATLVANKASVSAEKSANVATDALKANIESFQLDQRPWLGVRTMSDIRLEAGKTMKVKVTLFNSGKTPAIDFCHYTYLVITDRKIENAGIYEAENLPDMSSVDLVPVAVFPNTERVIDVESVAPLTSEEVTWIKSGFFHAYIIDTFHYRDVFNKKHTTGVFEEYAPKAEPANFAAEPTHNDAD